MRSIGLDVGRHVAEVAIAEPGRPTRSGGRIGASPGGLEAFAASLSADDQVVLEATTNTWAIVDLLERHAGRVVVSNPLRTRAIADAKTKTDTIDARTLAELLAADYLPTVWQPDPDTRVLRRRVAPPGALVAQRTRPRTPTQAGPLRKPGGPPPGDALPRRGLAPDALRPLSVLDGDEELERGVALRAGDADDPGRPEAGRDRASARRPSLDGKGRAERARRSPAPPPVARDRAPAARGRPARPVLQLLLLTARIAGERRSLGHGRAAGEPLAHVHRGQAVDERLARKQRDAVGGAERDDGVRLESTQRSSGNVALRRADDRELARRREVEVERAERPAERRRDARDRRREQPEDGDRAPLELVVARAGERPDRYDARIVHEHIDAAEPLAHLTDELLDALLVRHVEAQRDAVLARDPLQALDPSRADDDPESLAADRARRRRPDRGGRPPRRRDDLAVEDLLR